LESIFGNKIAREREELAAGASWREEQSSVVIARLMIMASTIGRLGRKQIVTA